MLRVLFFGFVFLGLASLAQARIPAGLLNCDETQRSRCDNFWKRQSAEQKKFLLSFPVGDRNAAITCFALHGYGKPTEKMRVCARTVIGDRKSMSHCERQGHELMSEAMVRCQNNYRRKHDYPLPY